MSSVDGSFIAAEINDAHLRCDGPLHPDDFAALRHGGVVQLARRRHLDRVAIFDQQVSDALEALRTCRARYPWMLCERQNERVKRLRQNALDLRASICGSHPRSMHDARLALTALPA